MVLVHSRRRLSQARSQFQRYGIATYQPLLTDSSCAGLLQHLEREMPWSLVLMQANRTWELSARALQALDSNSINDVARLAYDNVKSGFSFLYETNSRQPSDCSDQSISGVTSSSYLDAFVAFLNAPSTLDFFRDMTGLATLNWANAQASRFRAGHFLITHDDENDGNREVAYVLNMTSAWDPDWGGLLQFKSSTGEVIRTLEPKFNTLYVFRVPQRHAVSIVAPFAAAARYAVSGWFHSA
jgi:SM-20-related protein